MSRKNKCAIEYALPAFEDRVTKELGLTVNRWAQGRPLVRQSGKTKCGEGWRGVCAPLNGPGYHCDYNLELHWGAFFARSHPAAVDQTRRCRRVCSTIGGIFNRHLSPNSLSGAATHFANVPGRTRAVSKPCGALRRGCLFNPQPVTDVTAVGRSQTLPHLRFDWRQFPLSSLSCVSRSSR